MIEPRHYMMRRRRGGPLVPARLWQCDHEPGEPENVLDRPPYWRADIGDTEVDPHEVLDRCWSPTAKDLRPGYPPRHWKYAAPITEARYRQEIERLRWAETHRPTDPGLQANRRVDPRQTPLPNFTRENQAVE